MDDPQYRLEEPNFDIDIHEGKYRFEERVQHLVLKGRTEDEAKKIVEWVIRTKENPLTTSETGSTVEA
jgi:hypothetical protein